MTELVFVGNTMILESVVVTASWSLGVRRLNCRTVTVRSRDRHVSDATRATGTIASTGTAGRNLGPGDAGLGDATSAIRTSNIADGP